jgi:hypothetical protein
MGPITIMLFWYNVLEAHNSVTLLNKNALPDCDNEVHKTQIEGHSTN